MQIPEEGVGHLGIVVLSRVDDDVPRAARCERPGDRRELHEVRPRADDGEDGRGNQKIRVSV